MEKMKPKTKHWPPRGWPLTKRKSNTPARPTRLQAYWHSASRWHCIPPTQNARPGLPKTVKIFSTPS